MLDCKETLMQTSSPCRALLRRSSIRDFQSFELTIFKKQTAWSWTWHSATKVPFHCLLRYRSRLAIFAPARSTEKVGVYV